MNGRGFQPGEWLRRLREEPVLANFGWLTYERLARMALGLWVGTWMARYLGPAGYGTLSYGISITGILSVVPMLGLDAIVRRRLRQNPGDTSAILGTAFLLKLGAGILTYAATAAGVYLFESNPTTRFIVVVTALLHVQQSMMVFDVFFQSHLQSRYSVWAQNIGFTVSALGRVALILSGADIEAFAVMLVVEMPVTSLLFLWFYRRGGGRVAEWRWERRLAGQLLGESWPLAIAAVANIIYLRVDQVLLLHLSGPQETGRYAAAARLYELSGFLPAALASSLAPALLTAYAVNRDEYRACAWRLLRRMALLGWGAALPGVLLAGVVVRLLFGPAYATTAPMFAVLLLAYPFLASAIAREQILIAERKPMRLLAAMGLGVVSNVGLNLLLIPRLGGLGAAIASLGTQIAAGVLSSFVFADTREIGRWQIRALFGRKRPPDVAASALP